MTANSYAFQGRNVLVTGGGSGIGRAIAHAFLANGASVTVTGRRSDSLAETLVGFPVERTLALAGDAGDPLEAQRVVDGVLTRFGSIDVVVSNAAQYSGGDLADLQPSTWETLRATNIDGFVYLAQAVLPALVRSKGNLVAISSVSGQSGDWGQAAYNATKHAINGFVRSLALDYGARGVRVNAVAPAFTLTAMTESFGADEKSLKPFLNRIALGRPGRPEDIAPAVLFLASADAAYITGTILTVDGGTSASSGQPHID